MLGGSVAGDEEGGEGRTTVEVELDVDVEVETEGMLVFGGEVAGSAAVAFSASVSCGVAGLLGFVLAPLSTPLASLVAGLLVHGE